MRRAMLVVLLSLSLVLPLGLFATSASARDADRASSGLLITYTAWGKLHRGMTVKQGQRTGMVSHVVDRCAGGDLLKEPFRSRGYIAWSITDKATKVGMIVVTGAHDHTKEGTHPGTTLAQLRRQHPHLSKVVRAGSLSGQVPQKKDIWVAWVTHKAGTITYQFPFGTRPQARSHLDTIVVYKKPAPFFGC